MTPAKKQQLLNRAKKIKLLALDVDGVLTGGEIIVLRSGEEVKIWNSKDRLALAMVRAAKLPFEFAWITGRSSDAVVYAAEDLGVQHVVQKCSDKKKALEEIMKKLGIGFDEVAFVGDDLIDLPALRVAGLSACPSDAASDVLSNVHYVSPYRGGAGVVRDVLELILRSQKKWEKTISDIFGV